ncbi:AraC family transcriptional regulator [Runella salmonicolor]|uniref:AraC family transcriptional regulator n=1 Tax=Runella salmonicolor TaxID=2950278 RepID=A0ABT1FJV6_9BACT|nr:AraC family transcriptional regulator [Runella salmonicolor]MCP1381800.1 AraC family transcriptional regulator [Runella salmonicolor]
MKPTFALLPDFATSQTLFVAKEIIRPAFATDFHFHDECQLVYIRSGAGTRIIGGSIEHFEAGDLTFVGPRVPHVWYSKPKLEDSENPDVSIALYIHPVKVVENLKPFIDTQSVKSFFQQSTRGISITGSKKEAMTSLLQNMIHQKNVPLLASFIQILDLLLDSEELVWLNGASLLSAYSNDAQGRVAQLMDFIQQNFRTEITLEKAASVTGLQLHSFCRFFKSLTHRTFSDFINEVRVGFACQLLQHSDIPITQVAFESGYSNISYFNRSFRKIHRITPREFRAQMSTLP